METTLVFEGGGTRTRIAVCAGGVPLRHAEGGPCNPFDIGVDRCVANMAALARGTLHEDEVPVLACAGVAGARAGFAGALAEGLCRALSLERALVSTDLYPILFANAGTADAILAVAGTGSSVMAQSVTGAFEITGGRGALFGDRGSAYAIAVTALRAAAEAFDGLGPQTALAGALLDAVGGAQFNELVRWTCSATKRDVAALCPLVTGMVDTDSVARAIVIEEARYHADVALAGRRKVKAGGESLVLAYGGVFDGSDLFFETFAQRIRESGHTGPVRRAAITGTVAVACLPKAPSRPELMAEATRQSVAEAHTPPTEDVHDSGRTLDMMAAPEIVESMSREDANAFRAVQQAVPAVAALIDAAARAIENGGRVIYIGAGTSGRLGVLDASEWPPTFGVPPDRALGIIAGGERALRESVEGAEDDTDAARRDLQSIAPPLCSHDLVVGIAASGTTPYTLAALDSAESAGANTALICCNPRKTSGAHIVVALDTGPEVLAGSTRLKAGTATKLVLNMISTGAMALTGYAYHGRMVGVRPLNAKLWSRAIGIVEAIAGCPPSIAERCLRESQSHVPTAIVMAKLALSRDEAASRLDACGGKLRAVLDA